MTTTKTEEGVHVLGSGNTFERLMTVNEPCAFSFAFSVDGNLPLEFSVMLRAKGKDMQLLPASKHAELNGEVLLPGAGTCIARWLNPSGWVFNAPAATLYFKLQVLKQTPMPALKSPAPPAPPAPAEPASAEPVEPPSPEPPSSAMLAAIDAAVEVAKAKATGAATDAAAQAGAAEAARAKAAAVAKAEEAAAAAVEQAAAAEAAKAEAEAAAAEAMEAAKTEVEAEAAAAEAAKAEMEEEAAAAASAALKAVMEASPSWVPSTSSVASWVTHEGLLQKRTSTSVPAGGIHEV